MSKHIKEFWNPEYGIARCVINYTTSAGIPLTGIGVAECHTDDEHVMSELTGSIIAEYRATIDLLQKINKYEIKPAIAALKHVHCTMRHSKKYNPRSYEAIRLKRELAHLMDELEENKRGILNYQEALRTYIKNKDIISKRAKSDKES